MSTRICIKKTAMIRPEQVLRQKNIKIQDVAREAGVSTATVSRALSNPDLLTEATRNTVMAAIRTTGYRVNKAARNLRTRQAGAVLVLVPNLGNPFFSRILAGINEALGKRGLSALIMDTSVHASSGKLLVDYFLHSQVDGVICLDGALSRVELEQVEQSGLDARFVFACEWVQHSLLPSVRSDNEEGARLAVRHLYELGHRKIAHVTGPECNVLTHERRKGMVAERSRLGLPARDEWIIRGDFSLQSGKAAAETILAMEDKPTAVFCASDQVAFGLATTMAANGVRVPEDLSVIGFDDIELSEFYLPALTTIRQDRHRLGTEAASLLVECLDAGSSKTQRLPGPIVVPIELVARQSTTRLAV